MNFDDIGIAAAEADDTPRDVIKGHVLQADADTFAYYTANLDRPLAYAWGELKSYIDEIKESVGAEHVNLHLTLGLKGGRENMATVQPYQENRAGRDDDLKHRVRELRELMATYSAPGISAVANRLQEADDSMTQYQLARIETHGLKSTYILSADKDLWMVRGMHIDPATLIEYEVTGYDSTAFKEVGNVKPKLVGRGTSWFWHQLLIGDTADKIPGLPKLTGKLAERYVPLKTKNPKRKDLPCGPAKAVAVLNRVTTDIEAARRVLECYTAFYGNTAIERLVEQAFLLWMRRVTNPLDVLDFLNVSGIKAYLTPTQKASLGQFKLDAIQHLELVGK